MFSWFLYFKHRGHILHRGYVQLKLSVRSVFSWFILSTRTSDITCCFAVYTCSFEEVATEGLW